MIVAADGVYGTAAEWAAGPEAVYTVLARRLVDEVPAVLRGTLCLDVGAGTGVLSHMLVERGGTAVEIDLSLAMLRWRRSWRPPAIVADVRRLPMRGASIDLVVAGFVLNHLAPVEPGLRELARVLRPGGRLLASTWPAVPSPAKEVGEKVLREHGWLPSPWYADMRARASDTGDPLAMSSACASVGLQGHASIVPVELPVTVEQLTGWRAGLPHTAGWLGSLGGV